MNIDKALEAARRVERARAELKAAEEEFAAVTAGRPISRAPTQRRPIRGRAGAGPSVSQRVLGLITNAGPGGIPRKDIVGIVGKDHEVAVHSALKVHQGKGRIANKDGQWSATAKLVKELQAPPRTAEAALLGVG